MVPSARVVGSIPTRSCSRVLSRWRRGPPLAARQGWQRVPATCSHASRSPSLGGTLPVPPQLAGCPMGNQG
eukprot:9475038-Pyramimonas_sp.AAC.1